MFVYTCVCSDFILILVMFCLSLLLSLTMLEQGHGSVGGVVALLGDGRGICVLLLHPVLCSCSEGLVSSHRKQNNLSLMNSLREVCS